MNKKFLFKSLVIAPSIALGAVVLSGCNPEELQALGSGQYTQPPQTVSIAILNYKPASGKSFHDIFVSNFSVKAAQGKLKLSTARDGISDELKAELAPVYGFIPGPNAYSINPGMSDLLLYLMGVNATGQALLSCPTNLQQSSSNDAFMFSDTRLAGSANAFLGLRDCEKSYLGLDSSKFDNNGNGIPDYLKIRCGMNPKDKTDSHLSSAGDGVSDYDKCKQNIPIDENANSQPNKLFAYQYNVEVHADGTANLYVSNIPILNNGKDNFLAFYVTEVDLTTKASSLYTAFTILKDGSNGLTLRFNYWATDPSKYFNQQVVTQ